MQGEDSFPEGRLQAGLHKRSAEDKGAPCARQERSSLGRFGDLAFSEQGEQRKRSLGCCGVSPLEGVAEECAGVIGRHAVKTGEGFRAT